MVKSSAGRAGHLAALACTLCIVACGGGGGGGDATQATPAPTPAPAPPPATSGVTPLPALPATGTGFSVASDVGDPIGGGKAYAYSLANAGISVSRTGALLRVQVAGDEPWIGQFVSAQGSVPLVVGDNLNLSDVTGAAAGAWQSWGPEQLLRNCPQPQGTLKITDVAYSGEQLTRLGLDFEQRCAGAAGSLRGRLRWDAADTTQPPGPTAAPADLWRAAAGATPAAGNYVHLEGGTGVGLGTGPTQLYTPDNALISLSAAGRQLKFIVRGDSTWFGRVFAMSSRQRIEVGYYPFLLDTQRYNPAKGALGWTQPTESCATTSSGWVAVDKATYAGDRLQLLELRFEQACGDGGSKPPLRGQARWTADDTRLPPGPQAVPASLWAPAAALLPASGNVVFLDSEPGDFVGGGQQTTLLPANQEFVIYESAGKIELRIGGIGGWSGTFKGPAGWGRPQPGYYGSLLSAAFGNPARGGLQWSFPGRGCNAQGWFAIDAVTYSQRVLRSLDLRFQQGCAASGPVLRGKVRWLSPDPVVAQGPIDPVTTPVATPPLQVPATGSHALLDSGDDDFIGLGGAYLYTQADAVLSASVRQGVLSVSVQGEERWSGLFTPPPGQAIGSGATFALAARNAQAPNTAGLDWGGEARGCNGTQGTWSVQNLRTAGERVLAMDLSFEQTCDGAQSPLRGRVRLEEGDPLAPPGPVSPPPAGLWQLPAEMVPASGNFLAVHSAPGAYVGEGRNRLFTAADAAFSVSATAGALPTVSVTVTGAGERWDLGLNPMVGRGRLEPGYYGNVKRSISQNPARGSMDFFGASRSCNELSGWYVVDSITYEGASVAALAVRFEMLCENASPPVHGQLRWAR